MATDTNLNVAPYFDDFNEIKNFHRILFKPTNAVQTRELNQLQTILQNQIERFGSSIYKDGAVISGCGVQYYENLSYVRLSDHVANGELTDVSGMVGMTVESVESGLKAKILTVKPGTEQNFPWTNRLYVKYMNSGSVANVQVQTFRDNETLNIFNNPRVANSLFAACDTYANSALNIKSAGIGYGMGVSDGLIFQKGFFIRAEAQTLVVSDSINPGNAVVGFITNESIVTSDQDSSLFDNALGYVNPNAPGADRLKLTANLTVIHTDDIPSTSNFTSIVQYIGGIPVIQNSDDKYSGIGDEMARRSFETNGSFVIKPFKVDTVSANASHFVAQVSAGSGYAQGHRVELLKTAPITVRRGNDTASIDSQLITTNYGNYVLVNEMTGPFAFDRLQEVEIWDTPQQAMTKRTFSSTGMTGSKIGVANLRSIKKNSGVEGNPATMYEFYLFNIRMNPGANFGNQAKSVRFTGGAVAALGDLVFINGQNLFNSERRAMVWKFGTSAIKTLKDSANNINTQYILRQRSTSTLAVDGTVSLTLTTSHAGGTNEFPYGVGILGSRESEFTVVTQAAGQSAVIGNGNASGNTLTYTGINTKFSLNEYILVGSDVRRVTAIAGNVLTVDAAFSAANTSVAFRKYFPSGYSFPLVDTMVGTRTVTINSPTNLVINTGTSVAGALDAVIPVSIYHNVLRYNAVPAKKVINENVYVKIDTATHPRGNIGPWSLGLTDVTELRKVAVDTAFNETAADVSTLFYFDTGMRDTHYDIATLSLRPGQTIPANSKIVVVVDAFSLNTSPGVGFLSVDSYPVNDANPNDPKAITTANIPVYFSDAGVSYSLRDCIDFRPCMVNTGSTATTLAAATVNPTLTNNQFNIDTSGTYCPAPDETFETDLQYYLGRKENIYFSNKGFVKTLSGTASANPVSPLAPADGMSIAVLTIPPFPSLSAAEMAVVSSKNRAVYNNIRDTSSRISTQIVTNKRYRMQDIATLDARLSRVEYYTTLNMLEQATTSLQVPDANGLDRFKNGIFVDPFTNFTLADVSNPEFRIAIDADKGIVRPFYNEERPELDFNLPSSINVVQNSRLVTLPFDTTTFIEQPFATNFRAAASVQYKWTGSMTLFPSYGHNIDKVADAAVNVTLDTATPWQDFANSPFGMNWGDWRVTNVDTQVVGSVTTSSTVGLTTTDTTTTTTATTTASSRDGQKLNIATNTSTYNLGTYVEDVTIQPYIASVEVAFYAWGVRPSTVMHFYFEDDNVDGFVAPGVRNGAVTDTSNPAYVTRTAAYGTPVSSDADGKVYGKFLIPAGKYRVGERILKLSDIANLKVGSAAATTSASATYTASNFSVTTGSTTLTTVNPIIQLNSLNDALSTTTSSSSTNVTVTTQPAPVIPPLVPPDDLILPPVLTQMPNDVVQVITPPVTPEPVTEPMYTTPCGTVFTVRAMEETAAMFSFPQFGFIYTVPQVAAMSCQEGIPSGSVNVIDPLAQMFRINIDSNSTGMYMHDITVFFQSKAKNSQTGVTLYLTEILNGYPDGSKIIPFSRTHLDWNQVAVSDNGLTGTTFTFEAPVYLSNGKQYSFAILPDGGDPDYTVWTAVLGNFDVASGVQVSSKPYIDTAFISSNQSTWSALQDEYVKFSFNRCRFKANAGTAKFNNSPMDYMNIGNLVSSNAGLSIRTGDSVFAVSNGAVVPTVTGKVSEYYAANNFVKVASSTGQFNSYPNVQFHRLTGDGTAPSAATLVSSANIIGMQNVRMNAIVPRFATIAPSGTSISLGFNSCSNTYVADAATTTCVMDTETELFDFERIVPSRSNEVSFAGGNRMMSMSLKMTTDNNYLSPAIDLIRSNFLAIGNVIDGLNFDLTTETSNNGAVKNKYLSKVVTLASGQDSEDLRVYLTAFKPLSSKVAVFAKFLNGEDSETIVNKTWTQLAIDDDTVYSDYRNVTDYRELMFTIPGSIPTGVPATTGYVDSTNGLTYTSSAGSSFSSYKSFQLKIVLLSDSTSLVPRLNDVRALAMLL